MGKAENVTGFLTKFGRRQVCVRMPDAMFQALKHQAIIEGRSIPAQVMDYIECGLEVDKDWNDEDGVKVHRNICVVDVSKAPTIKKAVEEAPEWTTEADGTLTRIKD